MTTTRTLRPLKSLSVAVVAAAALTLSACGSGSDEPAQESDGVEQTQDASVESAPAADESPTSQSTASANSATGGQLEDARTAIETAEAENGGTAYHIDFDDNDHWEIDVIGDKEWEYHVSADGTTVEQTEEDDVDDDDRGEVDNADIPLIEALEIALEDTPGTIDDADLDEDDGTLRWEVEIHADGSSDSREVIVDATSGEVRSSDNGDDDGDDD